MNKYLIPTLLGSIVLCGCYHAYRAQHVQVQVPAAQQVHSTLMPESVLKRMQELQKDMQKSPYPLPRSIKC